ncbi:MAG: hypothetical protein LBF95_08355 [Treponema sp.]|jgi:hypothetical protein|nr:hypothetical protein [Treponema sp.]
MNSQHTGESQAFQPLCWGFLVYEVVRLTLLIRAMGQEIPGGAFPSLIFGAANTLFVLMALFLLVDFYRYSVYASLYTAGKIISVITLISCGFFWRDRIIQAIVVQGAIPLVGNLLAITLGDLVSAAGGIFLVLRVRRAEHTEKDTETGTRSLGESAESGAETGAGENGGL